MYFEPSFLNSIQVNKKEDDITVGGYTYPGKPKPNLLYNKELINLNKDGLNNNDLIEGGSNGFSLQIPVGLILNKYDNIPMTKGTYTGVIDMPKIDEFLHLNYKPLKQLTKKKRQYHNTSVKQKT